MKKVLSVMLVCMMLVSALVIPVSATGAEEIFSLTDLVGDFYAVKDVKRDNVVSSSSGKWINPSDGTAALGTTGDAVEMSFNITMPQDDDSVNESATIVIYDGQGGRVYMGVQESGAWITNNSANAAVNFAKADAAKMINQDVTLLFVNNGMNYSIYMKENGSYRHILTTEGKRSGTGTAVNVTTANNTVMNIATITYFDGVLLGNNYYLRDNIGSYTTVGDADGVIYTSAPLDGGFMLGNAGDFAEIKFRTNMTIDTATDGNNQYVDFSMADKDAKRAWLRIHENGAWFKNGDATENLDTAAVTKIRNVDATLLIVNNGDNYLLYVKNADGAYEKIFTSTGKGSSDSTRNNIAITGASGASVDVEYAKCYAATGMEEAATLSAVTGTYLLSEQNFATVVHGDVTKGANVSVADGVLTVPAGESVALNGAPIPVGGYADVSFKTAKKLTLQIGDGTAGCDIYMNISATRKGSNYAPATGAWPTFGSYVENRADEWHTYRIVREAATVYSVYHKGENDKSWVQVITSHNMGERNPNMNAFKLTAVDGPAQIDLVNVYGFAGVDGLLVTDSAYKTMEVTPGATIKTDELRALVTGVSGQLIFAGYDDDWNLITAELHAVDGTDNTAEEVFDTTVKDGITKVKVFLWTDFDSLNPVAFSRNVVVD